MPDPALHPDVAPLAFLLGTWSGHGDGDYPTVVAFGYREESEFWHIGKPFIGYRQQTWTGADGRPSHGETGYWRCRSNRRVELVLAHPNGLVEISEGHCDGAAVSLVSTVMAGTSTAKEVTAITRRITVDGDELQYTLEMAAVGVPLGFHLRATLSRSGPVPAR